MTVQAVQPSAIRWGSYSSWEGPYWPGSAQLEKAALGAPFWERALFVLSKTEGGTYDAINMYDKCIFSAGLIQLCGSLGLPDRLFEKMSASSPVTFNNYMAGLPDVGTMSGGRFVNSRGELVDSAEARRRFYLGGAAGLLGEWSPEQKEHARTVCAVFASLLQNERFRTVQRGHVSPMLANFATEDARRALFAEPVRDDAMGYRAAMQCGFLSFAGNLPRNAAEALREGMASWVPGSSDRHKCIEVLRACTFAGVGIWPHRYNVIRPHLEEQFQVDLPDLASDLKKAKPTDDPSLGVNFPTVELWQAALLHLGYPLGPAGVDGDYGPLTRAALKAFERDAGLDADGIMDVVTGQALHDALALVDEAKARGLVTLSHDAWGLVAQDDQGAIEVLMSTLRVAA